MTPVPVESRERGRVEKPGALVAQVLSVILVGEDLVGGGKGMPTGIPVNAPKLVDGVAVHQQEVSREYASMLDGRRDALRCRGREVFDLTEVIAVYGGPDFGRERHSLSCRDFLCAVIIPASDEGVPELGGMVDQVD